MLLIKILRQIMHCFLYRTRISKAPFYVGIHLYKNTDARKRKNILNVYYELEKLTYYWSAFPDSYFRFGMFLKGFGGFDKMKSFIPQEAYMHFAEDKDSRYHILIDDKILFHDLMSYYGLPVPERYFTFRNGEFHNGDRILSDEMVDTIIQSVTDDRIFVKRFTGGAASGISVYSKKADGVYADYDGTILSADTIRRRCGCEDFIFEKQLKQEQSLHMFNPDTVNTIRVLTYENKIISATVRFGRKGGFIDNISKGGIAVDVDIDTGRLGDYGLRMYDVIKYYEHPDSHLRFKGTVISQWMSVRQTVEKAMSFLPYYKSVGYDIATTDNGPVIIEINTGAGINLSQTGKEYGLAKYFRN